MKREIRSFESLEVRAEGETRQLVGVAPPWDSLSQDLGGFKEKFERGAFGDLENLDVISTFEHDGRLLLGRTPNTLRLRDTEHGLEYLVELPDTTAARDLAENVALKNVRGSSFEFIVQDYRYEKEEDGTPVRVVTSAELFQVGPVTNPAYKEGTDVALRSLEEWEKETQEPEGEVNSARRLQARELTL